MVSPPDDFDAFQALSARLGADPLQIQGPGGNTSLKADGAMWIKASGTELARARTDDVFVAVDLARARAEIDGAGDGTCRAAMLDGASPIRPSIETTFHALLPQRVVLHTHSVLALAHVTSDEGTEAALGKLSGMGAVAVPYRKPGLPLTLAIREALRPDTRVLLLRNHGLIVAGDTVAEADERIREVENRLALPVREAEPDLAPAPNGWVAPVGTEAVDERATEGSFWPDHVVFLGPGLASSVGDALAEQRAAFADGRALLRVDAPPVAAAMLRCLSDVFARLPKDWTPRPIGREAEAALMDWDAEAYRQKLAGRG